MSRINLLAFVAITTVLLCCAPMASAHIGIGVNIGPAPVCPYGYFDYAPYDCAPYGYYGPDWFVDGIFIGSGPWFHGHHGFFGHVDNRYDPRHGYVGPLPEHGAERFNHFHANEARDGQGHVGNGGHEGGAEHALPGYRGGGGHGGRGHR